MEVVQPQQVAQPQQVEQQPKAQQVAQPQQVQLQPTLYCLIQEWEEVIANKTILGGQVDLTWLHYKVSAPRVSWHTNIKETSGAKIASYDTALRD